MVTQVAFSKVQSATAEPHPPRPASQDGEVRAAPASRPANAIAPAADGEQSAQALKLDTAALEAAVENIARSARNLQRSLQFSVDEVSGKTVITVIDKETDEIIRQIPREEILNLADHFGPWPGVLVETEA